MFTEENVNTFKTLCRAREQNILSVMSSFLKTKYTNVERTPAYVLAEGDIPVALVAHADTVFNNPPKTFFYDQECMVLWSPEGMGADDRAGVYAIMEIIKHSNLRPHVIITTGEESGCIGASKLVGHYYKFPYELKCLIQLDRHGNNDCVFYDCDNEQFEKFVESFGFVTDWGSLSDISVLAPAWGVAAANLSVGYYNEHSNTEFLRFDFLHNTIEKVKQMLTYIKEHPEMDTWKYIPMISYTYKWFGGNANKDFAYSCNRCETAVSEEEIIPVKYAAWGGYTQNLCMECFAELSHKIDYCSKCGLPWLLEKPVITKEKWICPDCRKELQNV